MNMNLVGENNGASSILRTESTVLYCGFFLFVLNYKSEIIRSGVADNPRVSRFFIVDDDFILSNIFYLR